MKGMDMATNLIATVSKSTIHSLAHQGILVHESFHQIRDLVRAHLGDAYALLFAEPSHSKDGGAIDWYTPVQGSARRLVDLPEEEQKTARAATVRMAQDISRVAAELKQSGIASQVTRGTILELALRYPDESCIYLVGEQPVFTCWGFGPGTPGVQPQDLTRLGQAFTAPQRPVPAPAPEQAHQPVPPAQPATAQKTRGGFSLLWLLPLLLLFPLFFLLTASFGGKVPLISIPGFDFKLPALPFPELPGVSPTLGETSSAEAETLRAEIQDLEKKVLERAELCRPETVAPGLVTEPKHEEKALVIPEKPSDMNFLHGRWLCDRGLFNKADGQALVLLYEFDAKGKGTATVRQKGRKDCVGSAVASMNAQGVLIIEVERQVCPDGRGYSAETIECSGSAASRAICRGRSGRGTDWGESVPFYKTD
jgi:hypothetical protein